LENGQGVSRARPAPNSGIHGRIEKKSQFSLGKMDFVHCCQVIFRNSRWQRLKRNGEQETRFLARQDVENGRFFLLTTYG